MRTDVEICATDDRLCQPCFRKNEEQLELVTEKGRRKHTRSCQKSATSRSAVKRDDDATDQSTSTSTEAVQLGEYCSEERQERQENTAASMSPLIEPLIEHPSTMGRPELEPMKANDDHAIDVDVVNGAGNQCETVELLKQQVDSLQTIVLELKAQVEFLRPALDWTVQRVPSAKPGSRPDARLSSQNSETHQADIQLADASHPVTNELFSEVVRRRSNTQRVSRDAVVAAVYVDQQRQTSRAANLVMSGLQPLPHTADATIMTDLCRTELDIIPDVVHCRRLGKITAGKVQPLLVVLRSAEQADNIMARAKNLRQSTHSVLREKVFINRHLTEAQARAAYELRCQRREATLRRRRHGDHPSVAALSTVWHGADAAASSTSRLPDAAMAPVVVAGHNVSAAPFVPTSSSGSSSAKD